jgi:hypothetical protein
MPERHLENVKSGHFWYFYSAANNGAFGVALTSGSE